MKLIHIGIVALCLLCSSLASADPQWRLVWSDEFDRDGLPDPGKWAYEEGFIRNHELQYYTRARKKNARVENGALVIEAHKEKIENAGFDPAKRGDWRKARRHGEYTSAALVTLGKASWTYGRIEIRAKLPTGRGLWPALWMLGVNHKEVGWPACGEIDIMENVGFDPDRVHGNVHTTKYNHVKRTNKGDKIEVPKPHEDFHVYAVEWRKDRIDFFVDGKKYFTFRNEGAGADAWPFDKPHYLLMNIAVGGHWGGQKGVDPEAFPQRMVVDYVRVYEEAE